MKIIFLTLKTKF